MGGKSIIHASVGKRGQTLMSSSFIYFLFSFTQVHLWCGCEGGYCEQLKQQLLWKLEQVVRIQCLEGTGMRVYGTVLR